MKEEYPILQWKGKKRLEPIQYFPAQLKEQYGEAKEGWANKIFWGDNLQVMSHLLKKYRGQVDLIYIDPPFDSKADYKKKIEGTFFDLEMPNFIGIKTPIKHCNYWELSQSIANQVFSE